MYKLISQVPLKNILKSQEKGWLTWNGLTQEPITKQEKGPTSPT